MEKLDLSALNLDVHESTQGLWNPEHGELELPTDWEFLASGDTFVTKQVKAAGILDFAPEHNGLADEIANAAAERAVAVGIGGAWT